MRAADLLEKGNLMVVQTVEGIPESEWEVPGVCGEWSVKDIIAHLAAYEHVAVAILDTFMGKELSPLVMTFLHQPDAFNKSEVEARKYQTAQQIMDEYQDTQVQATSLLEQIPAEMTQRTGTMPWYGSDCCLADYIARLYEHTCEHCAQIERFYERVKTEMEKGEPS